MRSNLQSYSILTPGVTGGDVVKVGTILNVSNCSPVFPPIDVRQLTDGLIAKIDPVAETLAVWTITPPATPTVGGFYSFNLIQTLPFITQASPGIPINAGTNLVDYAVGQAATAADTKVTLMQSLEKGVRNLVNAASGLQVTSSTDGVTGVETITAKTGYPLLNIVNLSQATTPFVSIVNTVPGVASIGTYNDLIRYGVNPNLITAGHTYGFVVLNFMQLQSSGDRTVALTYTHTLYVDRGNVTNYNNFWTSLKTAIGTIFP